MRDRSSLKEQARACYRYNRNIAIAGGLLFWALCFVCSPAGPFLTIPFLIGYSLFSLVLFRGYQIYVNAIVSHGFKNYLRNLGGMLWMYLLIFLWTLLLVIPGIIKGCAYFMTPYLLAEHPRLQATEATRLSERMTQGYKGEIFLFQLSFLGWQLLNVLTLGILGILFVGPYYQLSLAGMYDELKRNALAQGVIRPEELEA